MSTGARWTITIHIVSTETSVSLYITVVPGDVVVVVVVVVVRGR